MYFAHHKLYRELISAFKWLLTDCQIWQYLKFSDLLTRMDMQHYIIMLY